MYTVMSEEGSQTLCATNGVTYPSLCHLIQDTGNEGVAYAGACGSEKCSGGSVSPTSRGCIAFTSSFATSTAGVWH